MSLIGCNLWATEPLISRRIDEADACRFVTRDIIAYTTTKGKLVLCHAKSLETIQSTQCNKSAVWIRGTAADVVVVQASPSYIVSASAKTPPCVMGFSAKTLKKVFEITPDEPIVDMAITAKKRQVAIYDRSGTVTVYSIPDAKKIGRFSVEQLKYAQTCMRFEFTQGGDGLYFHLSSLQLQDHNVTRIIDAKTGKVIRFDNSWHKVCGQRIEDAELLEEDQSQLLLVTSTKGVYQTIVGGRDARLLFVPRGTAYGIHNAQVGRRRLALVFTEDWNVEVFDRGNNKRCDSITLPKGFVRSFSVSENKGRL